MFTNNSRKKIQHPIKIGKHTQLYCVEMKIKINFFIIKLCMFIGHLKYFKSNAYSGFSLFLFGVLSLSQ